MATQTLNVPATKEAKLSLRLQRAMEQGRPFDEELERSVMELPPVDGRPPIIITADMAKEKAYQSLSIDAIHELESAAEGANAADQAERIARMEAELADKNRQIAELTGAEPIPETPTPSDPDSDPDKPVAIEGWPNKDWKVKEIVEWNDAAGFPPVARKGVGMKKLDLLEIVLGEASRRGIEPDGD